MDLIDRYVFDVQRYLPPGQRDPVGTALADELRTLVRDSEAHSGRRTTEDELAALIRMRGHPYLLAQPYRAGRYLLIGPSLLPQYWQALKTALTIAFVAFVVVAAVFAVNGTDPIQLLRYLGSFWKIAVNIFLAVTIAFAIFDAVQARVLLKQPWDPRTLPAPTAVPDPATPTGSLADIATSGVLLLWWLAIPHYPWVLLGPVARLFTFTNEWRTAYLPVSVCFAAALAVHVIPAVQTGLALVRAVAHRTGKRRQSGRSRSAPPRRESIGVGGPIADRRAYDVHRARRRALVARLHDDRRRRPAGAACYRAAARMPPVVM